MIYHMICSRIALLNPTSTKSFRNRHAIMNKNGKFIVIGLVILLIILHHDVWNWDKKEPVMGFMPVALLWQALISVGAGITWYIATKIAWPVFDDDEAAVATESVTDAHSEVSEGGE